MPKPGKNRPISPLVGYYIPSPFAKLDRSYKLGNSKNNNTIVVEKYPLIVSLQTGNYCSILWCASGEAVSS